MPVARAVPVEDPADPAVVTAPMASPHPSGVYPPLPPTPGPTHGSNHGQPNGSYVPIQFENTYASELAPELGSGPTLPPPSPSSSASPSSPPTSGVPLKYLLIGSLVGGAVALAGLSLWNHANEPSPSDASTSTAPSDFQAPALDAAVAGPALSMAASMESTATPDPTPDPTPTPAATDDGELEATSTATDDGELEVTPELEDSDDADDLDDDVRAARLLARARNALPGRAKQAYRDAKEAYDLHATQGALQVMGEAACLLRQEPRAIYAYNRLRGDAQAELRRTCKKAGLQLD